MQNTQEDSPPLLSTINNNVNHLSIEENAILHRDLEQLNLEGDENNNDSNNNVESNDRIQQRQNDNNRHRLQATQTIQLGREAMNNLEQNGIFPIRRDDNNNANNADNANNANNANNETDHNNINDEDFERLLALCKHNIMSLYYERTSKPHPSTIFE